VHLLCTYSSACEVGFMSITCDHRIAASLYTLDTWFVSGSEL